MFNSLCWWRFIVSIPVISELTQKLTFMAMQQGAELSGNPRCSQDYLKPFKLNDTLQLHCCFAKIVLKCYDTTPLKKASWSARKTRKSPEKPSNISAFLRCSSCVPQMCTSPLKLHCHIFRCILLTELNTTSTCSQATQTAMLTIR